MSNSTHRVEVFRVEHLDKHPNADRLEILHPFGNYQAVVRLGDFKLGDLACYIPPDNILPNKPEYEFLKGRLRIKAAKLRGIVSQGLVLPAPPDTNVGDDVAKLLEIIHYEPPADGPGEITRNPPVPGENYDIDSWFRYGSLIPEGTPVELTEKIHGANTRASYQEGKFWMGSRSHFRKRDKNSTYWRVFNKNPWLKRLCKQNPGYVIYGETFGNVQELRYGLGNGEDFRVFDIWTGTRYLGHFEKVAAMWQSMIPTRLEIFAHKWKTRLNNFYPFSFNVQPFEDPDNWEKHYVPILYIGPYNTAAIEQFMNGNSTVPGANHIREGLVIKPLEEMWDPSIGRLILKAVSPDYLESA